MLFPHRQCVAAVASWALLAAVCNAQEPIPLMHRWEIEPQLSASWLIAPPVVTAIVDPERVASEVASKRVDEAKKALRLSDQPDLTGGERALQEMMEKIRAGEANRHVFLTLVSAAVALIDNSQAKELWDLVQHDDDARLLVERALIGWKSPLAKQLWVERVKDPQAKYPDLLVAIEGIGATGGIGDLDVLVQRLRMDGLPLPISLVVSRSIGALSETGLEPLAAELLASDIPQRELLAANVLARQVGSTAADLQAGLCASGDAATVRIAYQALANGDLAQARELAASMMNHSDPGTRLQAVKVLNQFDDTESLTLQALGIQDSIPLVRRTTRDNLAQKASQSPELKDVVDEVITYQLRGDRFEGAEQAILLAVLLKERERCPSFVDLLEHPDFEVNVRAGWALQELADEPEILAAAMKHAQRWADKMSAADSVESEDGFRVGFILEAFGRNKFQPANDLLMRFAPKIPSDGSARMNYYTRASAIWALGRIWEDRGNLELSVLLGQRLLDYDPFDPESQQVMYVSALAMGYIGDLQSLKPLNQSPEEIPLPIGYACKWAIERLEAKVPTP